MTKGIFLTIEGGEGAGKSTMMDRVAEWLESGGRRVVRTREPGGTDLAEKVRDNEQQARRLGLRGTPGFSINGEPLPAPPSYAQGVAADNG